MSKRLNLREFQQNLNDRLQKTGLSGSRVSTLGVSISGKSWLVDMEDIGEVLSLPSLTVVPFTKTWFRGVANIRGKLYSVIDLAAFQQSGAVSEDAGNRILLVSERHAFNAALLVDRVLGLRDSSDWQAEELDGQVGYQDESGERWRKLDLQGLLSQAEFLQAGI